jgi:hypothetical protein
VIRVEGQIALGMELIEGQSLRSYCRAAQPAASVINGAGKSHKHWRRRTPPISCIETSSPKT